MNRFRLASSIVTAIVLLCQFLLQPDNLTVWSNPKVVAVVIGAIAVLANVAQAGLPSWFQAPQAEAAMRRSERPGSAADRHPQAGGDIAG